MAPSNTGPFAQQQTKSGQQPWVIFASFSADGNRVMMATIHDTVHIWDLTVTPPTFVKLDGKEKKYKFASLSADNTRAVTISKCGRSYVWDLTVHPPQLIIHHVAEPTNRQYFLYPEGNRVVIESHKEGITRVWDLTAKPATFTVFEGERHDFNYGCFSPDGKHLITTSYRNSDGTLKMGRVWNLTVNPVRSSALQYADDFVPEKNFFSPDGTRFLGFNKNPRQLHIMDFSSNPELLTHWLENKNWLKKT